MLNAPPSECEMCGIQIGPSTHVEGRYHGHWHQLKPVERWLCLECGAEDQKATHPNPWHGAYTPTVMERA